MYEIRPETILTFLNDKNVKFPRFQRKQTWSAEQNMKLAISIFKAYPVGVTIINKETDGGKSTRWLLDGRQRRNALKLMLDDPENIYNWSKKFLVIKNTHQLQDLEDRFWEKIEEYLNYNEEEDEEDTDDESLAPKSEEETEDFSETEETQEVIPDSNSKVKIYNRKYLGNLDELLQIIKVVHKKNNRSSGFTQPFDFTAVIDNLPYADKANGKFTLSGKKVTTFINEYKKFVTDNGILESIDSFIVFITGRHKLNPKDKESLDKLINQKWKFIEESISIVELIENRLSEAKIGIIETQNISSTDSQMIFKLINDEGTPLTAVEILSAKPAWNVIVSSPSPLLTQYTNALYSVIGTVNDDAIVRWDYPATIYDRLEGFQFILPKLEYSNNIDKKITLGFKLLSGIYQKGIKKEDISNLASNPDIDWSRDVDSLVETFSEIGRVLGEHSYFKFLNSWNVSFLNITSDAITLNFCFAIYYDFIRKGRPIGNSKNAKIFISNAVILADKLVFEYVTRKWRGSSDSKISQNIKGFESLPAQFEKVKNQDWLDLISGINDHFKIEDENIKFSLMKSLVYHVYAIHQIKGPNDPTVPANIDHLMPQYLFDTSTLADSNLIRDALFNLCPLPEKDNMKKTNKRLSEIDNKWLKGQIEENSGIQESEYGDFSSVLNWEKLRTKRRQFFEEDFIAEREKRFNDE